MRRPDRLRLALLLSLALSAIATSTRAQEVGRPVLPAPVADAEPPPRPAQIDLIVINLPTTLSMKAHGSYFRLTHRFLRELGRGDFGDLAADLFSLDEGAIIGLEYRFAPTARTEAGIHRSELNRTIDVFGRWDVWRQGEQLPVSVSLSGSIEGENNLREHHQPGVAVTVSHTLGDVLAVYVTPQYVGNTSTPGSVGGPPGRDTLFLGLAGRVRFRPTAYIVVEASPRLAGHKPDYAAWNFGVEKHIGGHVMQLNFGNSQATTPGQLARGGDRHNVYLGFNITRKFY